MKHEKVAPGLLSAVLDYNERGPSVLARRARAMGMTNLSATQKPPGIMVFLRCSEQTRFDDLAAQGVVVNESEGTVRTAYLPIEQVDALSEHPDVERISATRVMKPRLNIAGPRVQIPKFRTDNGLTGAGVVVGIVDTGIDPNHADFTGRILRIWDQTMSGPGVPEGRFGLELTGAAIVASRDTEGHGSHVAGIAAGADATFTGVAPGATIVFVKTDFNSAHIASGIRYIFRVAQDLGLPAVVNLSLGSHFDAHDGTDDLSAIIDQQSGPGRIVCCAAGNEGEDNIHARARLTSGGTTQIRFSIPAQSPGVVLGGWYAANDRIEIQVQAPNGQHTSFQGVVATGNHTRSSVLAGSRVIVSTPGIDPASGDNHFEIQITGNSGNSPNAGTWKLLARGIGQQHAPLDVWASDFEAGSSVPFLSSVSDDMKIGSPGASARALTVAAFTTRNSWTDRAGTGRQVNFGVDQLAPFSSPGPLRKQQQKPDVAAPGAMIASALSADSNPDVRFALSNTILLEAGTSMATPFMTGVVALLLQQNGQLTPEDAKARIKNASRIPGQAPNTFRPDFGFGLVDGGLLTPALAAGGGGNP